LLSGIISGTIEPRASLRPDAIAEQLNVSTTPVREALVMLESDRLAGRPSRAISEHEQLIECIARGDSNRAKQVMERHILGALKDVIKHGKRSDTAPESDT
jgi:DNA-binding GntR family transcriptional regulator